MNPATLASPVITGKHSSPPVTVLVALHFALALLSRSTLPKWVILAISCSLSVGYNHFCFSLCAVTSAFLGNQIGMTRLKQPFKLSTKKKTRFAAKLFTANLVGFDSHGFVAVAAIDMNAFGSVPRWPSSLNALEG
jgi:hypothetical protein